ncbi:MAG: hypothetical protein KF819_40820, partial [Labilithrix sp.]|nr:hypothetical protein [Labilithrix sp.]
RALFGLAYDGFEGKKLDLSRDETIAKVSAFAAERLRGLVAGATSNAVADAVFAGGGADQPVYVTVRARAVHAAVTSKNAEAWLGKARTVAKRLSGISKESKPVMHQASEFERPDDATIVELVTKLDALTRELDTENLVEQALGKAGDVAASLDDIFTRMLVNDPADPRTPKRLELLSYGAQCMLRIGDFSKLV